MGLIGKFKKTITTAPLLRGARGVTYVKSNYFHEFSKHSKGILIDYNKTSFKVLMFFLLIASFSCKKEQGTLELAKDYLFVADIQQYCQGNCGETSGWEMQTILAKGHVMGIESDSLMQDYYDNSHFYLKDIRNGVFIEVRVKSDKAGIFGKLSTFKKTDMLFLKGKAEAVTATSGGDCTKGVVFDLFSANDIRF